MKQWDKKTAYFLDFSKSGRAHNKGTSKNEKKFKGGTLEIGQENK